MLRRALAALTLALGLAAGCGGEPTGGEGAGVRTRWYAAQPGYPNARPAVVGDAVYFGTGDGQLIARDRATGAARWAARVGGAERVAGANLVAGAGVVVAPLTRAVVGVDAGTGAVLWRYAPPPDTVGQGGGALAGSLAFAVLAADAGAVYVPAWGASLSALDLRTGAARWVWTPGRFASDTAAGVFRSGAQGAAVSGDTVFVNGWHSVVATGLRAEGWLAALDRATGRELWRVALPVITGGALAEGAPGLHGDLVIVSTNGGDTWAVDRTTRALAWRYEARPQYGTASGVQVAGGVVYVDGGDARLYALDAATGAVRWSAPAEYGASAELLVTDRRVYYPRSLDVLVFDRATGRPVATAALPGGISERSLVASPAAAADGRVFVSVNGAAWSFDEP